MVLTHCRICARRRGRVLGPLGQTERTLEMDLGPVQDLCLSVDLPSRLDRCDVFQWITSRSGRTLRMTRSEVTSLA